MRRDDRHRPQPADQQRARGATRMFAAWLQAVGERESPPLGWPRAAASAGFVRQVWTKARSCSRSATTTAASLLQEGGDDVAEVSRVRTERTRRPRRLPARSCFALPWLPCTSTHQRPCQLCPTRGPNSPTTSTKSTRGVGRGPGSTEQGARAPVPPCSLLPVLPAPCSLLPARNEVRRCRCYVGGIEHPCYGIKSLRMPRHDDQTPQLGPIAVLNR